MGRIYNFMHGSKNGWATGQLGWPGAEKAGPVARAGLVGKAGLEQTKAFEGRSNLNQ